MNMNKFFRQRTILVWLAPLLVLAALWFTDPDNGASTGIWLVKVATATVAIALSHWSMKAIFDYPEADRRNLLKAALAGNTAAAVALLAQSITFVGILALFAGQVHAQVPEQAKQYLPILTAEAARAGFPDAAYLGGLVDHETACPRKSQCWNARARLKTSREEGAGLAQITRTWRPDGSTRFDSLSDMRARHPALRDWSWENVYDRPDLQIRSLVLMSQDNLKFFLRFAAPDKALHFADASYNQGAGRTQSDRRACQLAGDCDPKQWFGNVARYCTASHSALYGSRSPCDISRHHVEDVVLVRRVRYIGWV